MLCRHCRRPLPKDEAAECPHCGESVLAPSGVVKSSTILISASGTNAVYRSVKEVPAPLRKKLMQSTNGLNSATIVIADRRGREEIVRAVRNLSSEFQVRFMTPRSGWKLFLPRAAGILLAGATGLVVWLLFTTRW